MNQEKIKYFLYARKSSESEDRQMASIDSQIQELKKIAKQNNLEIVQVFSESKSAKAPGREVYADMIARIKNGEASGIICWKLNRLARNPIDGGEISWMIQQGIIQHIQTFGRSYYPTDNVIVMAVELGMANQFIRDLSVDTKRGLKSKAERGWYPTFTTLGYIHNPYKHKGEKEIMNDPERFDLVKKMFELMLTGNHTPPKILEKANEEWGLRTKAGKKVARSTIYRIFNDPFYYGEFEYPKESGNWYKGKHEPMITREDYERIQSLLGRKGNPRPRNHQFAFTGLIRCGECGAMITAENKTKRQKNGNVHYYTYYHCTKRKNPNCTQKTIRREELERQVNTVLDDLTIPEEFKEWALSVLRKENEKEFSDRNTIIKTQQKEYNDCVQKLDNLIDMRANEEIEAEDFNRRKNALTKEKGRLKELLDDSDRRIDNWLVEAEQLFTFAQIAKFKFNNGTLEDKKAVLSALGSNLLLKERELLVSLKNELVLIEKASEKEKEVRNRLEPLNLPLDKAKLWAEYAQSPDLLRGRDSNPRPIGYTCLLVSKKGGLYHLRFIIITE